MDTWLQGAAISKPYWRYTKNMLLYTKGDINLMRVSSWFPTSISRDARWIQNNPTQVIAGKFETYMELHLDLSLLDRLLIELDYICWMLIISSPTTTTCENISSSKQKEFIPEGVGTLLYPNINNSFHRTHDEKAPSRELLQSSTSSSFFDIMANDQ